ncbi:MAG: protein-L-isoaspartate(D-aspartate) O-methyltransferase [Alphaproteobacteria bacterium]|nr:protein-L-isoaspartate(D-aspartate) O-methyltransferase [Alphaproteobacteria bacterium]
MGRAAMVEEQLVHPADGREPIRDARVLEAMGRVPRSRFLPEPLRDLAYEDQPLPIGCGQTISQPYLVAFVAQLLDLQPGERLLEVGLGTGYQAAVFHALGAKVYGVEILPRLADRARRSLRAAGCRDVEVRAGDGADGWPAHAPYDAIVVSAAASAVAPALLDQLAPGGRLVAPLGPPGGEQLLCVLRKDAGGEVRRDDVMAVAFVPLAGAAADP